MLRHCSQIPQYEVRKRIQAQGSHTQPIHARQHQFVSVQFPQQQTLIPLSVLESLPRAIFPHGVIVSAYSVEAPPASVAHATPLLRPQKPRKVLLEDLTGLPQASCAPQLHKSAQGSNPADAQGHSDLKRLQDTWLEAEFEVKNLHERDGKDAHDAEVLGEAKKRRDELWRQVKRAWARNAKAQRKAKAAVTAAAAAAAESKNSSDLAAAVETWARGELSELSEQERDAPNEPLRKKLKTEFDHTFIHCFLIEPFARSDPVGAPQGARQGIPLVVRAGSRPYRFTSKQKDVMRKFLCGNLNQRITKEMVDPVAQAAGLTCEQVRAWIRDFYSHHRNPTLAQTKLWGIDNGWRSNAMPGSAMAGKHEEVWRASSDQEKQHPARQTKRVQIAEHPQVDTDYTDFSALQVWYKEHHPFPTEQEVAQLAQEIGSQVELVETWSHKARYADQVKPNENQVTVLRASFEIYAYPEFEERQRLMQRTGFIFQQLDAWFLQAQQDAGMPATKPATVDLKAPMRAWLHANVDQPMPNHNKRMAFARQTGLNHKQVKNWFQFQAKMMLRRRGKKEDEGHCL